MDYLANQNKMRKSFRSSFWANLFKAQPERNDLETLLLSIPPFKNFSKNTMKNFSRLIHHRVYSANEIIFTQGDPGIALYIIQEGEVKIIKHSETGIEYELAQFSRGDFFGELALLDNDVRSATAIATKDSKIEVIFKPDLDYFIENNPKRGVEILTGIAKIISARLRILDEEIIKVYSSNQKINEGE